MIDADEGIRREFAGRNRPAACSGSVTARTGT